MFVYKTPLQGNHQHSAKSRSSQDGARLCYLGSQQKMQLCSSGFASLVTRCCFSLCWRHRTTTDKKKPQADKQAEIICYFWAFQYSISFPYESVSLSVQLCLCLAAGCAMWVWALQLCRQRVQPDTGWGVWLTCPYRNDEALKKHSTSAIWVAASFGVVEFSSRDFQGKAMSPAASAPAIRGQNLCVERMRPLSKWINQCQGLRRNGTELIPFPCKPFVPVNFFITLVFVSLSLHEM